MGLLCFSSFFFLFVCFLNYEKNVTENSVCFDDFIFIFWFIWLVPPSLFEQF